jgi:hypothetical protein
MKSTPERVSSIINRRSQDGRLSFIPGKAGGATAVFPPPHGGAMAGGSPEMPKLDLDLTTSHADSTNRKRSFMRPHLTRKRAPKHGKDTTSP